MSSGITTDSWEGWEGEKVGEELHCGPTAAMLSGSL